MEYPINPSEKIKLRVAEPTDVAFIYDSENDIDNWRISHTITPYSSYAIEEHIAMLKNSRYDIFSTKELRFIIEHQNQTSVRPIGILDIFDFNPHHQRAGLGILISNRNDRNKQYASASLALVIDYLKNILQVHQVYCNIAKSNTASLKLFTKHGFKITGEKIDWLKLHHNTWENELILQLIF